MNVSEMSPCLVLGVVASSSRDKQLSRAVQMISDYCHT